MCMFINEIFLFLTALTVSPINAKVLLGYETLVLQEEADPEIVASVLAKGYAPDLDETELEEVGRDPFLIAYAVTDPGHRSSCRSRYLRQPKNGQIAACRTCAGTMVFLSATHSQC